jgi:putative transposase
VKHGLAKRWQDWPFSSASQYLAVVGDAEAKRLWKEFPIDEYGKGWDD